MTRMMGRKVRRLAMSSALVGAALAMSGPARAQDYGLLWDGPGLQTTLNPLGATLEGNIHGVFGRDGSLALTNDGTVRGLFGNAIVFQQAGSSLLNTGLVEGAGFGLTTGAWLNPVTGLNEPLAIGTIVSNSGTIRGQNNDGVRLIGGGTVTNSGVIEGLASGGADGISMFSLTGQDVSGITSIGTVTNLAGGTIFGNRIGIILSTGGVVDNAGSISGNAGGVTIQDGLNDGGKTGTLTNSGSISGATAVAFFGALESASVTNSGIISGTVDDGIANYSDGPLTIDNEAGGSITGALRGIHAAEGAVIVTNAGSIRGNGTNDGVATGSPIIGLGEIPDGGISIAAGGSSITNSGSISGARFGITTYNYVNATTGLTEPRAVGTVVNNLAGGSIIGDGDDGVRLIGGGTVTNAGVIEGRNFFRAEGVSMFALEGQDLSGQTGLGTVINLAGGTIFGNRFGIGLSGGGGVENAGSVLGADFSAGAIDGFGAGILFQAVFGETGRIGTLTNSGSIAGGHGIIYGGSLASSSIANSGSITGRQMAGVINSGTGIVTIDNLTGGTISGAQSGVIARTGAVAITNAGTITGFGGGNNGGVLIERNGVSISNSGLIEGTRFGIVANPSGAQPWTAGTIVNNSGIIRGLNNDGMRLVGGGTITNSGLIEGVADPFGFATDGISMFSFSGQDVSGISSIGTVNNLAGGTINGQRSGIILSTGGTVNNAGSIWAPDFTPVSFDGFATGIILQDGTNSGSKIGTITNSGSISAGVGIAFSGGLATGSVANSGTIEGRAGDGVSNRGSAAVLIDNQAGGSITGALRGIYAADAAVIVTNAGSITGNGGGHAGIQIEQAGSSVSNSGTITGANFGITTASYTNAAGVSEGRAIGTIVSNAGTIRGLANDGVRLIGGGTVTNVGIIEGLNSIGSDGVSMLTHSGQDTSVFTSLGTVNNLAGGSIFGDRFGVILSTGGEVNNDGSISGNVGGVTIQDGVNVGGKTGTIANTGTISGGTSSGVNFGVHLVTTSLTNSGGITGGTSGVVAEFGELALANNGMIRGNGGSIDANRPDGGLLITAANASINNAGAISGLVHGIVVAPQIIPGPTTAYQNVARNTLITNSGTITGETDDGIRMAGGGNVVNSGTIQGLSGTATDGIIIFPFADQDTSALPIIGTVTNSSTGNIAGARIGIVLSKSGVVDNAGSISGGTDAGIVFQNTTSLAAGAAALTNRGTITGVDGVRYNSSMGNTTATIVNSGTITAVGTTNGDGGIFHESSGRLTVTNTASGIIIGNTFSIASATGALTVQNAGEIISSSGAVDFAAIAVAGSGLQVNNSGLIQGRRGIRAFAPATGSEIINSGTIRGTVSTGLDLTGISTITNSGTIEGTTGIRIDSGTATNLAGGTISGSFQSILLGGYGTIDNAGTINGDIVARGGVITNTGTINGNVGNFDSSTLVENYGVINGNLNVGFGIFANIDNYGTMGNIDSWADNNMNNWGTVGTIDFGGYDDLLTLRAGSRVLGDANAYGGNDQLRLDSGTAPVQTLGRFFNFELLNLISGQWDAPDAMGSFGTINITGGKLTLTGELSGTMLISGPGTFQIGAGGSVGGFTGNIANNGSMIVDIGSDYTLASAMSGIGSFQKTGPAMLTLSGTSTHTGPTTVSGGTLAVTGSVASSTLVQTGVTLAGTGTLGNVVLQPGATLSPGAGVTPGNGIGTLNLIGSLTFGGGSRLLVNANDAGQADRVNVTGNVTIGPNALVSVLAENGTWNTSTRYVLISVTGRILSSFSGVTSDLVFLEPKLSQNSKIVELTLKRKAVRLNSGAVTINQAGVANALDTMGDSSGLMTAVLGQNALGAQMAFDSLSGGFFGSLSNQLLAGAGRLQTALQPGADVPEAGIASWSGFTPATRSASSGDFRSGFSLAGDGVRLSMAAGWLPQERVATGSNGMATMETHYSGTMLGYAEGGFSAHAGAGFSWHRIIANRNISFPGYADGAQARYRGATQQLFAEVAQQAHLGPLSVTPFAGYSHIRVDGMDIREAGSGAGLLIDGQARRLGLAQLGLRTSAQLPVGGTASLSARLNLAWQRAWGDLDVVQNSRFAGNGAGFVYRGQGLASGGFDIDAGLELQRGPLAFTAGYRRSTVLQRYDDGAEVGMRLRF